MTFRSILNPSSDGDAKAEMSEAPAYFTDLNLDQIVSSITADKREYNLAPFFHEPLKSREAIEYRQGVMRDLENDAHYHAVGRFAGTMRSVREHLAQAGKLRYKYQKQAWLFDAVELYCESVKRLLAELRAGSPFSPGLVGFFTFLDGYAGSSAFQRLLNEIATLKAQLSSIRYSLLIGDAVIIVSAYHDEPDYGAEIQADFEKFKQGAASDHIFKFRDFEPMNHIEAGVLDRVARLNPEIFAELDAFSARSNSFFDPAILRFDREVQFYIAYIAHMSQIGRAGLAFCYPRVSPESKAIRVTDGYNLALAKMLVDKQLPVVTNDIVLDGPERIMIVSGPNQGGRRLSRGCSVLCIISPRSVVRFNSTSLNDAIFLSTEILTEIIALDALCLCVTIIDELTALSATSVSLGSTVRPDNVAERTFKIVRRPPDGLAYAISIAEKYGLTYAQLRDRLPS